MGFDDVCNTGLVLGLGFTSTTTAAQDSSTDHYHHHHHHNRPRPIITKKPSTTTFDPSLLTLGLSATATATAAAEPYNSNSQEASAGVRKIDVNKLGGNNNINSNSNNDHQYQYDHQQQQLEQPAAATAKAAIMDLYRQASPHSAVSSFSGGGCGGGTRVKRERDLSSEEVEVEKVSNSRASDEDEDGSNARKKLRLTKEQSALLEESFKQHSTLNPKQKQALARQLNLRARQVEVWFQNRRARTKLKQTEVDCEFLKKCCETLTDENRRLQKELQELKALKMAQPLYMHMPAATLTMCPSCERIGGVGVGDGAANKSPFSMASKPGAAAAAAAHFYNPFTNPSAAC